MPGARGPRAVERARREEDKDERRRVLLDAALALFEKQPFAAVKMADVAARAGFAKGTVFIYFATKEALFLALTDRLLAEWTDALEAALTSSGPRDAASTARVVTRSLLDRPALVRLLPLLTSVLEHNVPDDAIVELKLALLARIARLGAALEARASLPAGAGAQMVVRVHALVVGLGALCETSDAAARAKAARPELAALTFDFAAELESALADLLRGRAGA